MPQEPFAAHLHFVAMALRRPQNALVLLFRRYFERAPGWVVLTTRGHPLLVLLLHLWVAPRPVVIIRPRRILPPPPPGLHEPWAAD